MKERWKEVGRVATILVVEDNALLRKSLQLGFRQHGFCVWTAANGTEAVAVFREELDHRVDMVLSDVHLPGLNGPEAIQQMLALNHRLRWCFTTGDHRAANVARLMAMGTLKVFAKPFAIREVAADLYQLLKPSGMDTGKAA